MQTCQKIFSAKIMLSLSFPDCNEIPNSALWYSYNVSCGTGACKNAGVEICQPSVANAVNISIFDFFAFSKFLVEIFAGYDIIYHG